MEVRGVKRQKVMLVVNICIGFDTYFEMSVKMLFYEVEGNAKLFEPPSMKQNLCYFQPSIYKLDPTLTECSVKYV